MSYPSYYPVYSVPNVENPLIVDDNQPDGYKWYQSCSVLGDVQGGWKNDYAFVYNGIADSRVVEPHQVGPPVNSQLNSTPEYSYNILFYQNMNSPVYPSTFTCSDTLPIYMCSSTYQQNVYPHTPQINTSAIVEVPTTCSILPNMVDNVVETKLFDESSDRKIVLTAESISVDEVSNASSVGDGGSLRDLTDIVSHSDELTNRFDDSVVMDSLLIHQNLSSITEYVEDFMHVKSRVEFIFKRDFDDNVLAYCFVNGLKEEIREALELWAPRTLHEAIALAKFQASLLEERLLVEVMDVDNEGTRQLVNGVSVKTFGCKESGEVDMVKSKDVIDWDSEDWESDFEDDEDRGEELDGFTAATVGYGNITEETIEKSKRKRVSKSERKKKAREAQRDMEEVTVCARCHSLKNYGQVKNQTAENLLPDFDFDRLITTRLMKITNRSSNSTVVVMVVDCVDFDGSFPKGAAKSLFKALEGNQDNIKISKKLPKLVLVTTKVDLLPSQIFPTRLDRWVRHRAKANSAPKLNAVYLVSSRKDLGVRNLLTYIKELAGPRGNVWVIGAQNAGKSTLINAFAKKERVKAIKLTEAAVPGTTLGILRIQGVLSAKAKMYDTPGLLHPYLMSMRLNREEQKMIEIRKELKPRTYRMKAGQTIYVGGLMRLDFSQAYVQTIYVSIWASPNVSLHMGKTENANDTGIKHAGVRLQPPIGADRVSELGEWKAKEVKVSGTSWDVNNTDIAAAGFCWFSLGLKGEATVTSWTFNGVEVTLREPLVLDRARFLERPGFLLPKAISEALSDQNKLEAQTRKNLQEEESVLAFIDIADKRVILPTCVNDSQKQMTRDVAVMDVHFIMLMNEPASTKNTYGLEKKPKNIAGEEAMLIFDPGGGMQNGQGVCILKFLKK